MVNPYRFYTYAYLREDRTPYYIGKGCGNRAHKKHQKGISVPKDKSRILILKKNLTEENSFKHEEYMISVFGRKDLGTGILHNRTNGGEGPSGIIRNEEYKRKKSESVKGKNNPNYGKKGKNHQNYGKKWWNDGCGNDKMSSECPGESWVHGRSKEYKEEMSKNRIGKNNPNYGKSHSKETRKKMSEKRKGENNHNYGKSPSKQTREKISKANIGLKWWNDGCGNSKRSIKCPGENWIPGMGNKLVTTEL